MSDSIRLVKSFISIVLVLMSVITMVTVLTAVLQTGQVLNVR